MEVILRSCPCLSSVLASLLAIPVPADDQQVQLYNRIYHDDSLPLEIRVSYRLAAAVYFMKRNECDIGHTVYWLASVLHWDDDFSLFLNDLFRDGWFRRMDVHMFCRTVNVIVAVAQSFGTQMDTYAGSPGEMFECDQLGCISIKVFESIAYVDLEIAHIVFHSMTWNTPRTRDGHTASWSLVLSQV